MTRPNLEVLALRLVQIFLITFFATPLGTYVFLYLAMPSMFALETKWHQVVAAGAGFSFLFVVWVVCYVERVRSSV